MQMIYFMMFKRLKFQNIIGTREIPKDLNEFIIQELLRS